MSESSRKKFLYVVLVAACIWGWYNTWADMGDKETATAGLTVNTIEALQPISGTRPSSVFLDTTTLISRGWGADPFVRQKKRQSKAVANVGWILSGISYNSTAPIAFINQELVKIGDRVNNAVVVAIEKSSVTLELQGTKFELTITEG